MPAAHRISLLFCAALLSPFGAATAATDPADLMPPPGLYRIDMDTNIVTTLGGISGLARLQSDGATGIERSSGKLLPGGAWQQGVTAQGSAPVTECVKSFSATKPMYSPGAGICVAKGGSLEDGAWVIRQQCGHDEFEISIRKVDDAVWEYTTAVIQKSIGSAASVQSSQAGMMALFRMGRDHAPTEKERKKYAAHMVEYELAMKEEAAKLGSGLAGGVPDGAMTRNTVSVQKWTRIAEKCGGLKK